MLKEQKKLTSLAFSEDKQDENNGSNHNLDGECEYTNPNQDEDSSTYYGDT